MKPNTEQEPNVAEVDLSFTNLPLESWTEEEVVLYFERFLNNKVVSAYSREGLDITARYGAIAKARRDQAEQSGFDAEVESVRRDVSAHMEYYALAQLLEEYHKKDLPALMRGMQDDEVVITVSRRERSVSLKIGDVAAAFGGFTNSRSRDFNRALELVLSLCKATAVQQRNRTERSRGRNWAAFTRDLKWTNILNRMRLQDQEAL